MKEQVFQDKKGKDVTVEVKPEAEEMVASTRHQGHGPEQRRALSKYKKWLNKANRDTTVRRSTDAETMLSAQLRAAGTTGGRGVRGPSLSKAPAMKGFLTRIKREK
tara:strand:+ start:7135 stop:7452 length:318 start_codon:yes stop_codon:yes gene_type:complete